MRYFNVSFYSTKSDCTSGSPSVLAMYPTNNCFPSGPSPTKYYELYTCDSQGYTNFVYTDASCKSLKYSYYTVFNNTCSTTNNFSQSILITSCLTGDISSTSSSFSYILPFYTIILIVLALVLLLVGVAIAFCLPYYEVGGCNNTDPSPQHLFVETEFTLQDEE